MPRFRTARLITASFLGVALAASPSLAAPKKTTAKPADKATVEAKKKAPPVSEENKKKLAASLLKEFKFGMSKDEVLRILEKDIAAKYDEEISKTSDVARQDRIRAERKKELARVKGTYVEFAANKPSPWDVSMIEGEFAHGTNEAMLERWENEGGKNNRRFFFFYEGKLWKMFVSLDVSILPEDKRNFETFAGVMQGLYGPGDVDASQITWRTSEFEARAVDKLRTYDMLALVIEDPRVRREVLALREERAPKQQETNSIIKAVIDVDNSHSPDVKANSNAIDAVIKAQGGSTKKK
jgi:hypothetical protein